MLRGVSLRAGRDEIVSLIGPNGAGKSTLLKTIYGLVPARAGSIRLLGREITQVRADRLTQDLVNALNELVVAEGGRVYLAKDVLTRADHYRAMEPRLEAFLAVRRKWDSAGRLRSAQSVRLLGDAP